MRSFIVLCCLCLSSCAAVATHRSVGVAPKGGNHAAAMVVGERDRFSVALSADWDMMVGEDVLDGDPDVRHYFASRYLADLRVRLTPLEDDFEPESVLIAQGDHRFYALSAIVPDCRYDQPCVVHVELECQAPEFGRALQDLEDIGRKIVFE